MSRGGSYGGGESSLGYLFGSDEKPAPPPISPKVNLPPYGIDAPTTENPRETTRRSPKSPENQTGSISNNYHRAQGQNSGNFITVSPPLELPIIS